MDSLGWRAPEMAVDSYSIEGHENNVEVNSNRNAPRRGQLLFIESGQPISASQNFKDEDTIRSRRPP